MTHLTYLAMLLPWALLVVLGQWVIGADALRRRIRLLLLVVVPATAYLIGTDAVALSQGIWTIHRDRVVGLYLGNVPLEEGLFFLLTNLMVVQGIVLFNSPETRARARRFRHRSNP